MKKLVIILITGLCVWMAWLYPGNMLSPGDLQKGHADLNNKCLECHKPFWGIDSKKCIRCHNLADIGKDSFMGGTGSKPVPNHQNFSEVECVACHSEHSGIFPDKKTQSFSHDLLSENQLQNCKSCHNSPAGKIHEALTAECKNCHQTSGWKNDVRFDHNMISGDKNNCMGCHNMPSDNFHTANMSTCSSCHNTAQWKPSSFNHDKYFAFDGNHPGTCNNCHTGNNYKSYTCYNCHEHSESRIAGEHYEHGINNFSNCASCHRSGNKHDAGHNEINGEKSRKENKHHENKDRDDDD